MTPEEMQSAARSLARRRKIEGYTRKDKEQEALVILVQANQAGLPPARALRKADNHLIALSRKKPQPLPETEDGWGDQPSTPIKADSVLRQLADKEAFELLMEGLTDREKDIMRMTYQYEGTDEQIAESLGFRDARRLQIARSKILCKLRKKHNS